MNLLRALTARIWGTNADCLKLQLGVVAIPVSIVYRFGLAALVLSHCCYSVVDCKP